MSETTKSSNVKIEVSNVVSNEMSSNYSDYSNVKLSENNQNSSLSPPPNYNSSLSNPYELPLSTSDSSENQSRTLLPEISINDIENGQPQIPWLSMKKFYVFGFCFFPLWYIGIFYLFSKKKDVKFWARLCTTNALLISVIISYIIFLGVNSNSK